MFLDTNYLIANGRAGSPAALQIDQWVIQGEPIYASAVAWAEYLCGPLQPAEEQACRALLHGILPLDDTVASFGAGLFNATGRRSRSLPDCLIAAAAILARQPLATLDPSDFEPFTPFGLTLA
jgi:predicted nucleic acid-binding protein